MGAERLLCFARTAIASAPIYVNELPNEWLPEQAQQ
jgi:hypothetical protein